jgi:hypothetical protein
MFIILDRPTQDEFTRIYDHINELDGKVIGSEDDIEEYVPNGPEHIVAEVVLGDEPERWKHLWLASLGARLYSNRIDEKHWAYNSPLFAGPIPLEGKTRKVAVDGAFAEGRASYFRQFGVNYIGRANVDPQNIFVLDNKKGNPLHDSAKDASLEALYASLPDDWWQLCGFVSTANITKLEAFLEAVPNIIPIAFTTGAKSKLNFCGLDHVDAITPNPDATYGIQVRDSVNRLSYKLSLTPEERIAAEQRDADQLAEHIRRTELERKRALGITE